MTSYKIITKLNKLLNTQKTITILYILFALAAGVQSYFSPPKQFAEGDRYYTCYNNYVIFKNSSVHLSEGKDMYVPYPVEQGDLYKYTPTFALFFQAFGVWPDLVGLCLWDLLNALILLFAVYRLPWFSVREKNIMLLLMLPELMTSLQNEQSNGLIAGLLILAFGFMERGRLLAAALAIMASAFIKLFGIVGLSLFIFYPQRWKSTLYSVLAALILASAPLMITSYTAYLEQLRSFVRMLGEDHSASYGFSVMGWLHSWFGVDGGKNIVLLAGMVLFLVPLIRFKNYGDHIFRLLHLTSILIWIVIFNHKAESPTFIIAMAGISIWYVTMPKTFLNHVLLALAVVFTSLSPTDLFPAWLRHNVVIPYTLKAVPCIIIWCKIWWDAVRRPPLAKAS